MIVYMRAQKSRTYATDALRNKGSLFHSCFTRVIPSCFHLFHLTLPLPHLPLPPSLHLSLVSPSHSLFFAIPVFLFFGLLYPEMGGALRADYLGELSPVRNLALRRITDPPRFLCFLGFSSQQKQAIRTVPTLNSESELSLEFLFSRKSLL